MSQDVPKMSQNVEKCPSRLWKRMVGNDWENSLNAPISSRSLPNCPKMSQNVPKCFPKDSMCERGNRTAMCEPIPRFVFLFSFSAPCRERERGRSWKWPRKRTNWQAVISWWLSKFFLPHTFKKDLSSRLSTEMFFCFFRISFGEQTKDRLYFEGKFYYACASFSIFLSWYIYTLPFFSHCP